MSDDPISTLSLPLSSLWHIGETMRDVDPMLSWIAKRFTVKTFADAGAHVGEISLLARHHFGADLEIYAYEPHPALAELCQHNFVRAGVSKAFVRVAALSKRPSHVDLHERGTSLLGTSTVMTDRIVRTITVPSVHPSQIPAVHVLSIDTEGAEADIVETYTHWSSAYAAIIETHTREAATRIRAVMTDRLFEMVQTVDHPRFPYRLELWSR